METEIDALLNEHDARKAMAAQQSEDKPEPSPIDQLRDTFRDVFIPLIEQIAGQYGPKGVTVTLNAEDFLEGGRTIVLDIGFGGYRIVHEGTVMANAIAFSEVRYVPNGGETVAAGLTLRGGQLSEKGLADFILKVVASLIRAANRSVRP